jgi:gas vesicle protein
MIYYTYPKYKNPPNNALGVLGGMLIGALVGAVAMLFLAPRSGKETRTQIQKKGVELRDRTNEMMEDTLAQIGVNPNKIKMGVNHYEQLEEVSDPA